MVGGIATVSRLVVCAPTGPVAADLLDAARLNGVHCHVVGVRGRPDALPCSTAGQDNGATEPADVVGRTLAGLQPANNSGPAVVGASWRGSAFSSLLHLEDGPIDPISIERLAMLRDRHRGETAVIIGNGPSLNETELDLLTDVPIRRQRDLPRRQPATEADHYYVVEDTMVFRDNLPAIKACEADFKLFPAMYRPSFEDSEVDEHTIFSA